jgi:uncharacterized protein YkwD
MLTTAILPRPLLAAAVMTVFTFALLSTDASAARGASQCNGSLDIPQSADQLTTASTAIICLVNAERAARDVAPLKRDADLAQAARGHSQDMAQNQYFSHDSPDGSGLSDRLKAAGYGDPGDGWRAGEDLGWGTGDRATPNALVDAWMASDHHRRILLSATYKEIGVGVAAGAPVATSSGLPGATYAMDVGTIRRG